MLVLDRRLDDGKPDATLTLTLDERVRGRLRAALDDGREAGLFLERGQVLRDGDLLGGPDGRVVRVRAAAEPLSRVACTDALLFARLCYHLGNRHVPLQIDDGVLFYPADHVLDDMVSGLGATAAPVEAPFDPEAGAYGHHHDHDH